MGTSGHSAKRDVGELIAEFDVAMLVLHTLSGELRALPMSLAERSPDGSLWFMTRSTSAHVQELCRSATVAIVLQSRRRFVSLSGRAELHESRDKIRALWREAWRPWFPEGAETPEAILIRVVPHSAEYWDLSGFNGVRYWADALKAVLAGEPASDEPDAVHHGRANYADRAPQ